MIPFYTRFPEIATRETRSIHVVAPGSPLPPKPRASSRPIKIDMADQKNDLDAARHRHHIPEHRPVLRSF
jgi:hypothetical protein